MEDVGDCILANDERLNNIRYVDDTIIFAYSLEGLQILITPANETSQRYGLESDVKKTKYMVISKNQIPLSHIILNQQPVERVSSFIYLEINK